MLKNFQLKKEFRANVYAHALSFIINILAYLITAKFLFIWVELATVCFIGYNNAKSKEIFDRNINNHFIFIMLFYGLAHLILHLHFLYSILIFIFTYIFFILKDNGFNKSFQVWMYIQALLLATTLINFPFAEKLLATGIGFIEAQLLLHIMFYFFKNDHIYQKEPQLKDTLKIILANLSFKNKTVRLAVRSAISAACLYSLCICFGDLKPNWAVVVLVSSLQRDDTFASLRVIKGTIMGSIIGWPISIVLLHLLQNNIGLSAIILWTFIIIAFVTALEHVNNPDLKKQIILTILFLAIITCIELCLTNASYMYVHLKIINSLIGALSALLVLSIWNILLKREMLCKK